MDTDQKSIKRIGRKRRAAGWTLLTLGVIVAGVWVASGWKATVIRADTRVVAVSKGLLFLYLGRDDPAPRRPTHEFEAMTVSPSLQQRTATQRATDFERFARFLTQEPGVRLVGLSEEHRQWMGLEFWQHAPVVAPAAPAFLAPLLVAALLLRSGILARRRAMTSSCGKCGYSLAGIAADAPCPECGNTMNSKG